MMTFQLTLLALITSLAACQDSDARTRLQNVGHESEIDYVRICAAMVSDAFPNAKLAPDGMALSEIDLFATHELSFDGEETDWTAIMPDGNGGELWACRGNNADRYIKEVRYAGISKQAPENEIWSF